MKPGELIPLKDERDSENNLVKVSALFFLPEEEGSGMGVINRTTYNQENVAIKWESLPFKNKTLATETDTQQGNTTINILIDTPVQDASAKNKKAPAKNSKKKL